MDNRWNRYPRPQLVREDWLCLNGEWRFRTCRSAADPDDNIKWETINVPFCPESKLSGIGRRIEAGETMVYERAFAVPDGWKGKRILLHFGAVDQTAEVSVNDTEYGRHDGGYLPFCFDVTDSIKFGTLNSVRVTAKDDLDHKYPWGKQKKDNGGMWYTPVSGIWQTVWMEAVPDKHITKLKIDTGLDWTEIRAYGVTEGTISLLGEKHALRTDEESEEACASIHIDIHHPHNWTPEDPYLYDFTIESGSDRVSSYFALRMLTIEERGGYKRLCLNGQPYFFNGLLDQGYWQDGIYTPPGPDGFEKDILAMKRLGYNTLRKHIKIEPEQFYYDCDRLGMAVFQDMVNNSDYSFFVDSALPVIGFRSLSDMDRHRDKESRRIFLESMDETVKHLYDHPCICYWTIFNEGWGQFAADDAYSRLRELDSSRFIDSTSGWFHQDRSDVDSHHVYFKPVKLKAGAKPLVLSEFGGYACKLPDHCFDPEKTYGYRKCEDEAVLLNDITALYNKEIFPLVEEGLCAAIYTQVSDVEDETNGFLTYDREVQKIVPYECEGGTVILGNDTDHQGGRVLIAPAPVRMRVYTASNHKDNIRVTSAELGDCEVSLADRTGCEKGTTGALVTGILEGFLDLFGPFEGSGRGFDIYVGSRMPADSDVSRLAAFEILMARIINERYYAGKADPVQIAKIAAFAEKEYYGSNCTMTDQLAVSLGRMAMVDFSGREPEIEFVDYDFAEAGLRVYTGTGSRDTSVRDEMTETAQAMGVSRLGDLNEQQFRRKLPELEKLVQEGVLTQRHIGVAKYFYEENDRVLAGAIALKTGNLERFLDCIHESALRP